MILPSLSDFIISEKEVKFDVNLFIEDKIHQITITSELMEGKRKDIIYDVVTELRYKGFHKEILSFKYKLNEIDPRLVNLFDEVEEELDDNGKNAVAILRNILRTKYPNHWVDEFSGDWFYLRDGQPEQFSMKNILYHAETTGKKLPKTKILTFMSMPEVIYHKNDIIEYFKQLPAWKPGDEDYISKFLSFFAIREFNDGINRADFLRIQIEKWLVRCIKQSCSKNFMNKQMLIFISPIHTRKSTFIEQNFLPENLHKLIKKVSIISDLNEHLMTNKFFIFWDEFKSFLNPNNGQLSTAQIESFKNFTGGIKFDGRDRRANFIGATNKRNFIGDKELLTRYIPLDFTNNGDNPLKVFNPDYDSDDVDRMQYLSKELMMRVWAQAFYWYTQSLVNNYHMEFTNVELKALQICNENYMTLISFESWLRLHIKAEESKDSLITATEIFNALKELIPQHLKSEVDAQTIGNKLAALGYTKVHTRKTKSREAWKVSII